MRKGVGIGLDLSAKPLAQLGKLESLVLSVPATDVTKISKLTSLREIEVHGKPNPKKPQSLDVRAMTQLRSLMAQDIIVTGLDGAPALRTLVAMLL